MKFSSNAKNMSLIRELSDEGILLFKSVVDVSFLIAKKSTYENRNLDNHFNIFLKLNTTFP
jgi:hypothetical protein